VGEESSTEPLEVKKDPRVDTTLEAFREQDELLARIEREISSIHTSVGRLRDVRVQLEDFMERADGQDGGEAIREAGDALVLGLGEVEDALIQKRTVDGQTVINFPSRLNHHFVYLRGAVDGSELGLIDGARERSSDLMAEWDTQRGNLERLLGGDLDAFNALVRERGVRIVAPPVTR